MDQLHPELIKGFQQLPATEPVVLFTRHSIREPARNGVASYDIPLTEEGVRLAEQWGAFLGPRLGQFYSSPVGRCVETARAMSRGAGAEIETVDTHLELVEPGCFVQDIRKVGKQFLELGPVGFANLHLREELEGILTPREGARKLVGFFQERLGKPGEITICVSHDTILAAFIYGLLGVNRIHDEHWPWMMEGAWLWLDESSLHWIWRGQRGSKRLTEILNI